VINSSAQAWITYSFTCKQHNACLSFVSVHQMSPPQQLRQKTSNCSSLLIYRPRKDERLSWPSWLTYSGWLTHIPVVTHQLQVERRTAKAHRPKTDALPLDHATNQFAANVVPILVAMAMSIRPRSRLPGMSSLDSLCPKTYP